MYPKPEVVFYLAERIVKQKKLLEDLQSQWEQMFSQLPAKAQTAQQRTGRTPSDMSASRRIMALLNENPSESFNADEVAERLSINKGTARTNLSKLVGKGIEKRTFNTYGSVTNDQEVPEGTPQSLRFYDVGQS